jgi:hypothetical protein
MCEPLAISRLDPTNFHNSGFYFIYLANVDGMNEQRHTAEGAP